MFAREQEAPKTRWICGRSPLVHKWRDEESREAVLDDNGRILLVGSASFSSSVRKQQSEIRLDLRGRLQVVGRDHLCAGQST